MKKQDENKAMDSPPENKKPHKDCMCGGGFGDHQGSHKPHKKEPEPETKSEGDD